MATGTTTEANGSAARFEGGRGVLFLVVGPSGVGKDALIDAMRRKRPDLVFPKRVVTRSEDAGGEAHHAATAEEFEALEASGRFALSWRAHGLAYGVPISVAAALARGRSAMVNVSRSVIAAARETYAPVRVFYVSAPVEVLAARLAQRGRETPEAIAERLSRASYAAPMGADVHLIDNGGALETASAAMAAAIDAAIGPPGRITPADEIGEGS